MKKVIVLVLSLSIIVSGYLVYNSLNNEDIPIKEETLDKEYISYTLNGSVTDKSYEELVENNKVNSVTCENGSTAVWSEDDKTIKLSNINIPDYCTIDFSTEELTPQFIKKILADNPTISERTDFSVTNTSNTTGSIYKTNKTEDGSEVYYYSGNTTNNWVKFGKEYKCMHNGYEVKYVNDTSDFSYRKVQNESECTSNSICKISNTLFYLGVSNRVCINNDGTYLGVGAVWDAYDIYWRIIRTNEDDSVRILYSGISHNTTLAFISTSVFNSSYKQSRYVGYMYGGASSLADNRTNTTSSTIKGVIDTWYQNNLFTSYDKYTSKSAIYCNDRSISEGSWANTGDSFYYGAYTRLSTHKAPNYKCGGNTTGGLFESTQATADKFSASTTGGGNGQLTYPIALMTADEVTFAGGKSGSNLSSPYAYYFTNSAGSSITGTTQWWSFSPSLFNVGGISSVYSLGGSTYPGILNNRYVGMGDYGVGAEIGVRPVISIAPCAKVTGSGTPTDPYVIDETNSTC